MRYLKTAFILALLLTAVTSAELISIPSKDPDVRNRTKTALESLSYNCQGYLGLYGEDRTIRNADHFITIEKDGEGFLYQIEGHGIRKATKKISDADMLITTLLQHNAIFNLTDHFHLEPINTNANESP